LLEGCTIVTSSTHRPAAAPPAWRNAHGIGISQRLLIACAPFGPRLPAAAAASAIARGTQQGGLLEADVCPVPVLGDSPEDVRQLLHEFDLDSRMHSARAVIIGAERLAEHTLVGSITFEIATRARQSGVPAYAVTSEDELDAFDARILDLQMILRARGISALTEVGLELARLA
jgi:glycerate kinase